MPYRLLPSSLCCCAAALLLGACAADPVAAPALHDRLGGAARVASVVDRTIDRSASDPRTRRSFDGIKLPALKASLTQHLCAISGGGCRYEGATMAEAHKDARIRAAEFEAMVTILREELDRAGTDPAAKNELLRLLAPMKRDIVAVPAAAGAAARP